MRVSNQKRTMMKWVLGHKITPHKVSGDFDLVMGETPPLTQGPPPHHHNTYHEVFMVTEGEMEFMLNGEITLLTAGKSINLPPKAVHTFSNKSNKTCKWVNIHSPKGFLKFFENLGVPVGEDQAKNKSMAPELIQQVIETAAQYDMNITMQ
ncbi:MAG: cupin domain-containing protein [Croceitalea sp.]|nr:cupin domain-containing protein [Croceitalea sp.]